jgi:hypothetical protein
MAKHVKKIVTARAVIVMKPPRNALTNLRIKKPMEKLVQMLMNVKAVIVPMMSVQMLLWQR